MEDDDSRKSEEGDLEKKGFNNVFNASNVFQPIWVRCVVQNGDGLDRFLLDYGCNFLWYCGTISWFISLSQ